MLGSGPRSFKEIHASRKTRSAGLSMCSPQASTGEAITEAADLPDNAWPFDKAELATGITRGAYTYYRRLAQRHRHDAALLHPVQATGWRWDVGRRKGGQDLRRNLRENMTDGVFCDGMAAKRKYRFGVLQNRCQGWFQAVATPFDGSEERTSRQFADQQQAVEAIRYFLKNGRFRREEEEAADTVKVEICERCGQPQREPINERA